MQLGSALKMSPLGRLIWPGLGSSDRVVKILRLYLSLHQVNTYNALEVRNT